MKVGRVLARAAKRLEADLLPDVCTITTVDPTPTISDAGVLSLAPVLRTYNGSTSIPCRLDASRSFRPEKLPDQEVNANEYVLYVPRDLLIKPNDKVTVTVDGVLHVFEIRKFTSLSEWRVVNSALMDELEFQHD